MILHSLTERRESNSPLKESESFYYMFCLRHTFELRKTSNLHRQGRGSLFCCCYPRENNETFTEYSFQHFMIHLKIKSAKI
ncbi:CLUMA_CG011873, isoform A [Clunio marinus]|uniref:CLUMA_CG011873, isoform A n=1 Tax=Clunio marinus TaxID=568069 RepID=A0A1J1IE82_9DIPT|nr:CLUMA_CG011873, isoform A [Clunio marinus]